MAIRPANKYPANTEAPTTDYPLGSGRNIVTPGDGTGTPLEKDWVNDIWGYLQALLQEAGVTPSDTPDTAVASQYLESARLLYGGTFDTFAALDASASVKVGQFVITQGDTTIADGDMGFWRIYPGGTGTSPVYTDLTTSGLQARRLWFPANKVFYDNSTSGLTADEVKSAIDELKTEIDSIGAAAVTSVFGRTGAVVAADADYSGTQVTFSSGQGLTSTRVSAALDELKVLIDAVSGASGSFTIVTGSNGTTGSGTWNPPTERIDRGNKHSAGTFTATSTETLRVRVDATFTGTAGFPDFEIQKNGSTVWTLVSGLNGTETINDSYPVDVTSSDTVRIQQTQPGDWTIDGTVEYLAV